VTQTITDPATNENPIVSKHREDKDLNKKLVIRIQGNGGSLVWAQRIRSLQRGLLKLGKNNSTRVTN